jgi:hypothetical protein
LKFGKTQSLAERASRRAERVGVGYPTDLTAGEAKPTNEAPERDTPGAAAILLSKIEGGAEALGE